MRVVAVTARSKAKKRSLDLRGIRWSKAPGAGQRSPSLFVELMERSGEPALSAIETARNRQSVVTANKALIAKHGLRLARASSLQRRVEFRSRRRRGVPSSKTLREGLSGTNVNRVYGILNGTCNYILTRMEQEGLSFAECLKDAQRRLRGGQSVVRCRRPHCAKACDPGEPCLRHQGRAERGLCRRHFLHRPGGFARRRRTGYRVKLLGVAVQTAKSIEQRVRRPWYRNLITSIAQVMGVTNAVTIDNEGHPADHAGRAWRRRRRDPHQPWSPISPTSHAAFARCRSAVGRAAAC